MPQDFCAHSSEGVPTYPNNDHWFNKIDLPHKEFSARLNFGPAMLSAPSDSAFDSVRDVTVSQVIFLAHILETKVTVRTIKAWLQIFCIAFFSRWSRAFADEHQPIINVLRKTFPFFPKKSGPTVWLEIKLTNLERGAGSISFAVLDVSE